MTCPCRSRDCDSRAASNSPHFARALAKFPHYRVRLPYLHRIGFDEMATDIPNILNHVSIGVTNLERSAAFYDAVMPAIGAKRILEIEGASVAYGKYFPEFWIGLPYDSKPATPGNGVHIALLAPSKKSVDDFYRLAIDAGGVSDGKPGRRLEYGLGYYGCFIRDHDGHKIEATIIPDA